MNSKPFSKIATRALFNALIEFLEEVKSVRWRSDNIAQASDTRDAAFIGGNGNASGEKLMNNMTSTKNHVASASGLFLLGGLVGGAVCAALAFLYAPQSGKRTQIKLKREADRLHRQVNEKAGNFVASAEEIAGDAADMAADVVGQGRDFVSSKARELRQAVQR